MEQLIKTPTDYSIFKALEGNRSVNKSHVNKLMASMKKGVRFTVITVNDNMEVIDGQHRLACLKKLNIPVNYVICSGYGLEDVQAMNSNSKQWDSNDFINAYAETGNTNYALFKQFRDRFKFGIYDCTSLLYGNLWANVSDFKGGLFEVKDFNKAMVMGERIEHLSKYYAGYKRRYFIAAMIKLFSNKNFSYDLFVSKLKMYPTMMVDCTSTDKYVELIESIYNYKSRSKVNLRF